MSRWSIDSIRDIEGKRIIVTGGASGIGFAASEELALKGADLVLAVRNVVKGEQAADSIRGKHPGSTVTVMHLDLGDLASVKQFAEEFIRRYDRLDTLINNAGVMIPPYRKTEDGFELQFGTNHLGHFALTGYLMPLLMNTPLSRVVTISSIAARRARIDFSNLDGSHGYNPMTFYRQSKLANLLFAIELQHRLERAGSSTISVLCHPGISVTNLMSRGSGKETGSVLKTLMRIVAQPAEKGALPTLYAATNPDLRGGEFIGPDGPGNKRGYPILTNDATRYFKPDIAAKLWEISESLTGVRYSV
ncbi:MAG: oxidoreductase [Bacteroidales bacterium]|jgi:NAD(P)-dependent dehydrogenase (short-subunit alcohol dehydrogenase family)|nr:oxidoreductase [Bacteroidales bacterium]